MKSFTTLLALGSAFVVGTIAIVAIVIFMHLPNGIAEVLLVFAGMFAIGALTAFGHLMEDQVQSKTELQFDEDATRTTLESVELAHREEPALPAWEPTVGDLLVQDTSLALAKLRIDLEHELRRIAQSGKIASNTPANVTRLLRSLEAKGLIPTPLASVSRDLLSACYKAVHGADVQMDVARSVLGVGTDVVSALKSLPAPTAPNG
jgi:hypothetical protein